MTRSHVLLHCPNDKLRVARVEAWEGRSPGAFGCCWPIPRWEQWFIKFLELSGVGRVIAGGIDVLEY